MLTRPNALGPPRNCLALALTTMAFLALAAPGMSVASPAPSVVTFKTVKVGAPGNPSVGIVPFTDAIYASCADAPQAKPACQQVGGVKYRYGIGHLEVTVKQWVTFLNRVDPAGRNRHRLYSADESSSAWPKYGQINFASGASRGRHYSVASPEWADKPYGFANFLRSARFANSLYNGRLLSKQAKSDAGFRYVTYRVRLSRKTERGMYNMRKRAATRSHESGFVVPSQDEWVKAAYYDASGGGQYSYWKYPTNPGVFGDGTATAPSSTTLDPSTGDVTNASTQPLATFHASNVPAPSWCPAAAGSRSLLDREPLWNRPDDLCRDLPGQPQHRGSGEDDLAVGDPRPGRQRRGVDRHHHPASVGAERWADLETPARRHRQRPRLSAVALGSRAPAAGQHALHRHLPVAGNPDRSAGQPEGEQALSLRLADA